MLKNSGTLFTTTRFRWFWLQNEIANRVWIKISDWIKLQVYSTTRSNRVTNHLVTIRGDFLGSKSSNTGSSPGYWNWDRYSVKCTCQENGEMVLQFWVNSHSNSSPLQQYFAEFYAGQMPWPGFVRKPLPRRIYTPLKKRI